MTVSPQEDSGQRPPRVAPAATGLLLITLGLLVVVNVPELGSDPWPFRLPRVEPTGPLATLVRAAGGGWEPAILRAAGVLAGLLVALAAVAYVVSGPRRRMRGLALALSAAVVLLLVLPAALLQAGLRQSTEPWFFTNDSNLQIEVAGELVRSGSNPYGHDYGTSGMERFYSLDGSVSPRVRKEQPALAHLPYFPGTPLSAAAWGVLPAPWSDYRMLVALATLALLPAALLLPGPLGARLAAGAALAANPLAVRGAWFGTNDAVSVLCLVLAFGLLTRRRWAAAGALLGAAVLLKQFALVALPFLAAWLLVGATRREAVRAGAAFALVAAIGFVPFLVADPGALWADTVVFGSETYRIVGYGLPALLAEAGLVVRGGAYPVSLLTALVWLPATALLILGLVRSRSLAVAAGGFAASIFILLFLSRVFQQSYLLWPLAGMIVAGALAAAERERAPALSERPTR